ncbi:unnamed protein product [Gongylonema pulchrum]|uniref:MARVEL domain-containing protein n=1 Tax=Gongylonema pulchrum TaxID=637853 RepID=A0A183EC39_9BILA|nr:unnamed protein product [Gongylonema pulchrum]
MTSVTEAQETVTEDEKHEKSAFVFDKDDAFYMAPAVARLMHYRNAAVLCGLIEITILIVTIFGFFSLQLEKGNTHLWLSTALIILLVFATVTTFLMIYGILAEKPKYMWPQMAFMHIEVTILTIAAILSITSMSMGLQATHRLFGIFIRLIFGRVKV